MIIHFSFVSLRQSPSELLHQAESLHPFSGVKKGDSIVLYGAGAHGQRLYYYIKKTGFCSIAAWVDLYCLI